MGGGLFNALETHEKSLIGCPSVVNYRSAREFGDQSLLKMTDNLIVTLCIITEEMYLKNLCSLKNKIFGLFNGKFFGFDVVCSNWLIILKYFDNI